MLYRLQARQDIHGQEVDRKRAMAGLIVKSSIEVTTLDHDKIQQARELLPKNMNVYLPSLPNQTLMSKLGCVATLRDAGFEPVPHLAARRIPTRQELESFLKQAVQQHQVDHILLVGGDIPEAAGPYSEAAMILKEGILAENGIRLVGLPAFPEGHPRVSSAVMQAALDEKIKLAREAGHEVHLVTQFSFAPDRVTTYCEMLSHRYPGMPVYVGLSGPTNPAQLLRYAKLCGVTSSLRAVTNLGLKTTKLLSNTDPDSHLTVIAQHQASNPHSNIAGVHIFSFGGFISSARWMHRVSRYPG